MPRLLVACECSGVVRRAFERVGWDAWSCDLLPAADGSAKHFQCDVLTVLDRGWDAVISHPVCTYLTNSAAWAFKDPDFERYPGVGYHQKVVEGTLTGAARRKAREDAHAFALAVWNAPARFKVLENPVGALSTLWRKPSQIIQPYHFGDDASKATCLWIEGWPLLQPTQYVEPRLVCGDCRKVNAYGQHKCLACGSHVLRPRWANQTDSGQNRLSPGDTRSSLRSETFPGIAAALASQLGVIR